MMHLNFSVPRYSIRKKELNLVTGLQCTRSATVASNSLGRASIK